MTASVRPNNRPVVLESARAFKMARSAHAYVRGSTALFYEWLSRQQKDSLPEGPPIWICGDCHAGNLGPIASLDGRVSVQIRDLDQTVIGNPAHDLIRLALSLATASRGDAAYWMKGCSSLGLLRFAVLLELRSKGRYDYSLIDIKEATTAAAPHAQAKEMPTNNAQRVVEGAKHLSPSLGQRMIASKVLGKSAFIRELLPQDLKIEIDRLTVEEAALSSSFLASVVGKAHGRQMDEKTRRAWAKELHREKSATLDAPSWLWSSVVSLIGQHEQAYLEHCRTYARESQSAA